MADVVLKVAAELDPASLRKIRAQIEAETRGKPINISVGLDTKSIRAFQAQIKAAMASTPMPITVAVDQKSLNQSVKNVTAAFSQILSMLGTNSGGGGNPAKAPIPASGAAVLANQNVTTQAAAKKYAEDQRTLRTTIETEGRKTRETMAQDAAKTRQQAKLDHEKNLSAQQANERAKRDAANNAASLARTNAKNATDLAKTTTMGGSMVMVADKYSSANVTVQESKERTRMAELEFRKAQAAAKIAAKESEFSMIKRYQQATALYQLGNIVDKIGVPYAGQFFTQVGSVMQAAPTMPLKKAIPLGIGVAALTTGLEFTKNSLDAYGGVETQLTRIRNLTDSTDADITNFKTNIAGLSAQTGRSQADVAKGLYFIASSGFKGADAFKILEAATKSSVAGMGETATMADVLTSAMNAYGIKAADAYKVTDKFIAAVREGKAEPQAFATSLGAVMPFAREAGVSLEELLAAMSSITLQTGNASMASTSVKQAIISMYAPSKEGSEMLDLYYGEGQGAKTIQKKLSTEGLSAALTDLYDKSGGSIAELDRIFGNVRALAGVFQLSTGRFAKFNEITQKIVDASGLVDEGFARSEQTWEVQYAKFKQGFEAFKIGFGEFAKGGVLWFMNIYGGGLKSVGEMLGLLGKGMPTSIATAGVAANAQKPAAQLTPFEKGIQSQPAIALAYSMLTGKDFLGSSLGDFANFLSFVRPDSTARGVPYRAPGALPGGEIPLSQVPAGYYMQPQVTAGAPTSYGESATSKLLSPWLFAPSAGGIPQTKGQSLFSPAFPGKLLPAQHDRLADQNEMIRLFEEGKDARVRSLKGAEELNGRIAGNMAQGINNLITQSERYDDFYGKYADIVKRMESTPDYVTVMTSQGKGITAKQVASEDTKIKQLELTVKINALSDKIRATAKPSKDATVRERAGYIDQRADLSAAAKAQELADLQAKQGARGKLTYRNPEEERIRKEQQAALEDYNRGTFETFAGKFNEYLKGSTGDLGTFNALLRDGGTLMGTFAESAGLLKSSGFVTSLGEAALEAKYLRDNLTGEKLKGADLIAGLADYGKGLQAFKTDMLGLNKFISGEEVVTKKILIDFDLIDATASTSGANSGGHSSKKGGSSAGGIAALGPKGIIERLFAKHGLKVGEGNAIEQAMKIQMKFDIGDSAEGVEKMKADAQKALESISEGLRLKAKLEAFGFNPWTGKGKEKKGIESVLGPKDPSKWVEDLSQPLVPDIVVPSLNIKAETINTEALKKDVEKQVGAIDPKPVIVTRVDISKPAIEGEAGFRSMITGTMQSIVSGFTFNVGDIKWTASYGGKTPRPDGYEDTEEKATGGSVGHSGMVKVGELGPEYVWLPGGSYVYTASQTTRMAAGGVETYRGGNGRGRRGASSYSNTEIKVDARGATEPVRVREQAEKGVTAAFNDRTAKRRARETGQI